MNIVLQNGRVVTATVTDNWPTRPGSKKATGSSLPSRSLTAAQQARDTKLAADALVALGFTDGVFHVEMKGGDMLEINVRPGGSYTVSWDAAVYGVDEAEKLFMTAAGIPLSGLMPEKPLTYLEGVFAFSPRRGLVKKIGLTEKAKAQGLHILIEKKPGSTLTESDNRVAFVYSEGESNHDALANIHGPMSDWLELEIEAR